MQTYLFFLDKLSALVLEIIINIVSIFGILISFYGLSKIPFYIEKKLVKAIFYMNIPFFIIILLISLIFIVLRKLRLINNKLNQCSYYLSITLISLSLLGFILNVIIDTLLINNMYFYNSKAKKNNTTRLNSNEWRDTILVIIFLLIIYFSFIFLALSDNLRINLKIDDSYYQYQLAIEEEINIEKNQPNPKPKESKEKMKDNNKEIYVNNKVNINNHLNDQIGSDNDLNKKLEQNEEKKV